MRYREIIGTFLLVLSPAQEDLALPILSGCPGWVGKHRASLDTLLCTGRFQKRTACEIQKLECAHTQRLEIPREKKKYDLHYIMMVRCDFCSFYCLVFLEMLCKIPLAKNPTRVQEYFQKLAHFL